MDSANGGTGQRHRLKILFVTSQALPFFKSGGLADVSRSLPDALQTLGHEIRIFHPFYSFLDRSGLRFHKQKSLTIPWVGGTVTLKMFSHADNGSAPAILPRHAAFTVSGSPYEGSDESAIARRFALFCRAALHYAQLWGADVIHLNDWQTGLVPAYALTDGISLPTLFSIHNIGYQGNFPPSIVDEIDLPRELYRTENGLEFYGSASYLKGGLALSSRIGTVSPTHAREIQTREYGAGLDGLMRFRSHVLVGILNGIDAQSWNPATDATLTRTYDAESLHIKDELRMQFMRKHGLDPQRPLLAVIGRLAYQKGIDLILDALPDLIKAGANVFILGDGDAALESRLVEVATRFPRRVAAVVGFDDAIARQLYAGADFYLMPSRYEPCGLGQMISQRYGTPPIVRATGGLRDTVRDGVTGLCFERATVADLVGAVRRAVGLWRRPAWDSLRRNCMRLDWSWHASAHDYVDAYTHARSVLAS